MLANLRNLMESKMAIAHVKCQEGLKLYIYIIIYNLIGLKLNIFVH